jgi:hypothetical protein
MLCGYHNCCYKQQDKGGFDLIFGIGDERTDEDM